MKTKIQKGQKNQMTASNVEDKKQQPVDHAGKVKLIMETTMRSEEQVCWALQECDHDIERAVNMLYENSDEVCLLFNIFLIFQRIISQKGFLYF